MESLVKHIKGLKRIRFWMTFGQAYLTHLKVLENVGMTRIDEVDYEGHKIIPLRFLKACFRSGLARYQLYRQGSDRLRIQGNQGRQGNQEVYLQHLRPCRGLQGGPGQAVSYTTGVPAMIGR